MKEKAFHKLSKCTFIVLCIFMTSLTYAKKAQIITLKEGDPLILLQEGKTAIYDIDYSKLMVKPVKYHENGLDFRSWMIAQNEDSEEWLNDWVEKDSAECQKTFRECFNKEIKNGIKLTKLGKDYKVILKLNVISLGENISGGRVALGAMFGGLGSMYSSAIASGELEVHDIKTGEIRLILAFDNLVGEDAITQIKQIKGVYENLCEEINNYLRKYQKEHRKH